MWQQIISLLHCLINSLKKVKNVRNYTKARGPYEVKPRNVERHFLMWELLLVVAEKKISSTPNYHWGEQVDSLL